MVSEHPLNVVLTVTGKMYSLIKKTSLTAFLPFSKVLAKFRIIDQCLQSQHISVPCCRQAFPSEQTDLLSQIHVTTELPSNKKKLM